MTDDTEPTIETEVPEATSYTITITRQFEMDLTEVQIQQMVATTGLKDTNEAIGQSFLERETENVQPEQKLLGLDVQVDEPSDE